MKHAKRILANATIPWFTSQHSVAACVDPARRQDSTQTEYALPPTIVPMPIVLLLPALLVDSGFWVMTKPYAANFLYVQTTSQFSNGFAICLIRWQWFWPTPILLKSYFQQTETGNTNIPPKCPPWKPSWDSFALPNPFTDQTNHSNDAFRLHCSQNLLPTPVPAYFCFTEFRIAWTYMFVIEDCRKWEALLFISWKLLTR